MQSSYRRPCWDLPVSSGCPPHPRVLSLVIAQSMALRSPTYCCACRDLVETYKVLKYEDPDTRWREKLFVCWPCLRFQWRDHTKLEPTPQSPEEAAQRDLMFLRKMHATSRLPGKSMYRT